MPELFDQARDLPGDLLETSRPIPWPTTLLMCPPDHFDVSEVRNPYMEETIGTVDFEAATRQWESLREAYIACGVEVQTLEPKEACEDMVFCCDQSLVGLDGDNEPLCLLSHMKYPAREAEVPTIARWFERQGYRTEHLPGEEYFEGGGDSAWHPGRALLWGGYGVRSDADVYEAVSDYFEVPVIRIQLPTERFYHLSTCFCPLDEKTVLVYPPAMTPEGLLMIESVFERVVECDAREAVHGLACNATAIGGTQAVIDRTNPKTAHQLHELGYTVTEVNTSEFRKSGGSVYCMKAYLF